MANINPGELLGQDEDLSAKHALREGAHDGISTLVQYGTIFAIVAISGAVILDKKTRERLKRKWL